MKTRFRNFHGNKTRSNFFDVSHKNVGLFSFYLGEHARRQRAFHRNKKSLLSKRIVVEIESENNVCNIDKNSHQSILFPSLILNTLIFDSVKISGRRSH